MLLYELNFAEEYLYSFGSWSAPQAMDWMIIAWLVQFVGITNFTKEDSF